MDIHLHPVLITRQPQPFLCKRKKTRFAHNLNRIKSVYSRKTDPLRILMVIFILCTILVVIYTSILHLIEYNIVDF